MYNEANKGQKGNITQDSLVEVTAYLFMKNGYQATTMQEIADYLNIKKGSIYYYIKTKEDFLYKIGNISMTMLLNEAQKIHDKEIDPKQKITLLMKSHLEMIAENINLFTVSLRDLNKTNAKVYWNEIVKLRDQYENILQNIIEEGIQAGIFKNYHKRLIVFALLGMMNWLIRWYKPETQHNLDEIVQTWTDIFLNGITDQEQPAREKDQLLSCS